MFGRGSACPADIFGAAEPYKILGWHIYVSTRIQGQNKLVPKRSLAHTFARPEDHINVLRREGSQREQKTEVSTPSGTGGTCTAYIRRNRGWSLCGSHPHSSQARQRVEERIRTFHDLICGKANRKWGRESVFHRGECHQTDLFYRTENSVGEGPSCRKQGVLKPVDEVQ